MPWILWHQSCIESCGCVCLTWWLLLNVWSLSSSQQGNLSFSSIFWLWRSSAFTTHAGTRRDFFVRWEGFVCQVRRVSLFFCEVRRGFFVSLWGDKLFLCEVRRDFFVRGRRDFFVRWEGVSLWGEKGFLCEVRRDFFVRWEGISLWGEKGFLC